MQALNLPTYYFKLKSENERNYIFDVIRGKYIILTPEEWVRQNIVRYLNEEKEYPLSLMSLESGFSLYQTKKRTDILIFNREAKPIAMVECKAASIKINQSVFDQIIRYNLSFRLVYIIVTNGLQHYCCKIDNDNLTHEFMNEIPSYRTINGISNNT
jgi:type I site-specific restriction endonuclease